MASDDQGRTWHTWDAYSTWPKMYYADVVRRGNQLLAFGANGDGMVGTYFWRSNDEGLTWTGGNTLPCRTIRTSGGYTINESWSTAAAG